MVTTDSGQSIIEPETAAQRSQIDPTALTFGSYVVTAQTTATTVQAGSAIVFTGSATDTGTHQAVPNVPVDVDISVYGTTRTYTATTDSSGNFTLVFQPLAKETGNYQFTAAPHGGTNSNVQGTFTIVGMAVTAQNTLTVAPGVPLTGGLDGEQSRPIAALEPDGHGLQRPGQHSRSNQLQLDVAGRQRFGAVQFQHHGDQCLGHDRQRAGAVAEPGSGAHGTHSADYGAAAGAAAGLGPGHADRRNGRWPANAGQLYRQQSRGAATAPVQVVVPQASWLALASPATIPAGPRRQLDRHAAIAARRQHVSGRLHGHHFARRVERHVERSLPVQRRYAGDGQRAG